ncbi:MAG: 3-deoxy-D-manno-octulosonic acid transferase [Flavobacteriales bacterium]
MIIFYHIAVLLYVFGIRLASLFNLKAKLWILGRKNIFKTIESTIDKNDDHLWFHCASLGEFEQARPVIEKLKLKFSTYKVLVTFFSPSGYEICKNGELPDYVFYLPIDTPTNAKSFIELVNPKLVFFVKYEFWYNYILELKNKNIPTYLVSGVFRPNQLFFKWYGHWYKKVLFGFTHFFVQNQRSKILLNSHGFTNVTHSGDTRFDRVFENSKHPMSLPLIELFKNKKILIVGGSTWQSEEQILANYSKNNDVKLIIAPHDISKTHVKQIEQLFNQNCLLYSNANSENVLNERVLIIDNIGILANIYQYSDIAFIGGGYSGALHNILEPASFGNVILFGPNHNKYHEADELITENGAFEIFDKNDFNNKIDLIIPKIGIYKKCSREFVTNRVGATNVILNFLD